MARETMFAGEDVDEGDSGGKLNLEAVQVNFL
jgi:hypothetical protein